MKLLRSHCFATLAAGCASLAMLTGCTEPKETTAIGAATGGALGAGLGAIIGSQTGDAGSGLAIGLLAGSASGAFVGNAFQAQQESIRSQDEAIERQNRSLQAQRSEIDELRRMNSDERINTSEVERKQAALRNRGPNPASSYAASSDSRARLSDSGLRGVNERDLTPPIHVSESGPLSTGTSSTAIQSSKQSASRLATPETNTGTCKEADREAQAASTSSEQSDKLFHLRRALRLCPENPSYHHELGKVYLSLNRKTDAEYEFRQALSADPNFRAAKTSLDALTKNAPDRF